MNLDECHGEWKTIKVNHIVDFGNNKIIIRNVPQRECLRCGSKFYIFDVAYHLQKIIDTYKDTAVGTVEVDYSIEL